MSSAARAGERMVHQDFIARIRYSNALPPPPNPPKLLDIPNTGLASGQYTTPGFASRLARDQPLNIEADAELGMPLDLVGMPGIFDGDESSIQAPLHAPPVHPADRALLRPLASLGKPKFSDSGVSFLRRTEYISSYQSKSRFDSTTSKSLIGNTGNRVKKPALSVDKESLEYVRTEVSNSFQTAASFVKKFLEDPAQMRHPTKKNLKLVDAKLLIPDRKTFTDAGGYATIKFLTNPVPPSSTYDIRLENSLLRPVQQTEAEDLAKSQAQEAYERDPEHNPPPGLNIEYEFYMTETPDQALRFKRKFDALDPEKDEDSLYTSKNESNDGCFRFKRIRAYECATQTGSLLTGYDEEVMIADHDGVGGHHQRAAYYYPIVQRNAIRPQRTKNINKNMMRFAGEDDESRSVDFLDVKVRDPDDDTVLARESFREFPYGREGTPEAEVDAEADAEADADADADAEGEADEEN